MKNLMIILTLIFGLLSIITTVVSQSAKGRAYEWKVLFVGAIFEFLAASAVVLAWVWSDKWQTPLLGTSILWSFIGVLSARKCLRLLSNRPISG